jgi:hypothetical protein
MLQAVIRLGKGLALAKHDRDLVLRRGSSDSSRVVVVASIPAPFLCLDFDFFGHASAAQNRCEIPGEQGAYVSGMVAGRIGPNHLAVAEKVSAETNRGV